MCNVEKGEKMENKFPFFVNYFSTPCHYLNIGSNPSQLNPVALVTSCTEAPFSVLRWAED